MPARRIILFFFLLLIPLPLYSQFSEITDSAFTLISLKKYDDAINFIEGALRQHRDAAPLMRLLGQAYQKSGKPDEAAESFVRASRAERCDSCYADFEMAGMISLQAGNLDKARDYFETALKRGSGNSSKKLYQVFFKMGEEKLGQNDFREATSLYLNALQHQKDTLAFQRLLFCYHTIGESEKMIKLAEGLMKDYPGFLGPKVFMATKCYDEGVIQARKTNYKEAVELFTKALTYLPNHSDANSSMGYCYEKLKDTARAVEYYENARKLGSKVPTVYYGLALSKMRQDSVKPAIELLHTALQLYHEYVEAWELLSMAYEMANEKQLSRDCYRQAATLGCEKCRSRLDELGEDYNSQEASINYETFGWFLLKKELDKAAIILKSTIADSSFSPKDSVEIPPRPIKQVWPELSDIARKVSVEGTVWLKLLVSTSGKVKKVVVQKSDAEILNQPAIEAAMKWEFSPAMKNGKPIAVWAAIPFRFKIN